MIAPFKNFASMRTRTVFLAIMVLLTSGITNPIRSEARIRRAQDGKPVQKPGRVARLSELVRPSLLTESRSIESITVNAAARGARSRRTAVAARPQQYLVVNLEFTDELACQRFKLAGVTPFNRFGRWADVFVAVASSRRILPRLENSPGLVWAEFSGVVSAPLPPVPKSPRRSRDIPRIEPMALGGVNGLTGKGVIVAIVDSGVDFRSEDFITYDENRIPTSRIRFLWDTKADDFERKAIGGRAPVIYPNGVSVGTVYTGDELTRELRQDVRTISSVDANGHGTACAGIAAGNGNSLADRPWPGVAPEADIIAVRLGSGESEGLENAFLLNAVCAWIDSVAGATPVVVSCSFGGHRGGHDGSRLDERQLSARFDPAVKGRALCIAAGNEATDSIHAEAKFSAAGGPSTITWLSTEPDGGLLELYFDTADLRNIQVQPERGFQARFMSGGIHPLTNRAFALVGVPPGIGSLRLQTSSGANVTCDAYISGGVFDPACASAARQVGTPGTTLNAITVGSYDFNDQVARGEALVVCPSPCDPAGKSPISLGALSCYSNPGPARDVNQTWKPDIVAPGQYYRATLARTPAGPSWLATKAFVDKAGLYLAFNGTSAATPYVAGVIALMFQKNPRLTAGEVKSILQRSASSDSFTDAVPNGGWGYGKLNLAAIKRSLDAIP